MKLLITGDWHYRANPPRARLDDFQETLDAKIREVFKIAVEERCRVIVVPGDLTDSPSLAFSTVTRLENLIRGKGVGLFAIPGNHDEFGGNLNSLDRTVYGHLAATGAINDRLMQPSMCSPWNDVHVEGHGFSTDTDSNLDDYLCHKETTQTTVVVAHGMLLERSPGFELKHTLLEDVAKHQSCPDVLIVGHEHLGFGVKRLPRAKGGELVAINPGALVRLSAHPGEIERMPQVCLLEIYPGVPPTCSNCEASLPSELAKDTGEGYLVVCPTCKEKMWFSHDSEYGPPEVWNVGSPIIETTLIPLQSARPGHEVLSREHIEQAAERDAKMGEFLGLLAQEGEAKFLDIQAIVEGIAKNEKLPRPVVDEALRRIAAAREALGGKAV